jgi:hypothetical protein
MRRFLLSRLMPALTVRTRCEALDWIPQLRGADLLLQHPLDIRLVKVIHNEVFAVISRQSPGDERAEVET